MGKLLSLALPKDGDGEPISVTPIGLALAGTIVGSLSSAQEVTLQSSTQFVEVNALAKGVYMNYGGTAGTASFHEYVPADQTRYYAIPDGIETLSFLEQAASATVILIEK